MLGCPCFLDFHFLCLEMFLFPDVVYLLVSLLLYYSVIGLIKILLGSVIFIGDPV